ncbi:hypothetical protein [Priestia aryabhattai]
MNTLLNPKLQHEGKLEGIRCCIIFSLKEKNIEFDESQLNLKLKNVRSETKLMKLLKLSFTEKDIESFTTHI